MCEKVPFLQDIQRTATAAATYVIQAPLLEANQLMVVECVAYANETSNNKDLTWGFRLGNKDVWVKTIEGSGNGVYHTWVGPVTLRSENRLIFRVVSPASGDKTHVTVAGYLVRLSPGEPITE